MTNVAITFLRHDRKARSGLFDRTGPHENTYLTAKLNKYKAVKGLGTK